MGLGADSLQERTGGDPHPHSKGEVEMQPGECMASSRRDLIWGWCPWPGDSEAGGGGGGGGQVAALCRGLGWML